MWIISLTQIVVEKDREEVKGSEEKNKEGDVSELDSEDLHVF